MSALFILAFVLLATWLFGVWERDRRAAFMRDWVHVLLIAGLLILLLGIVSAIR